MKFLFIYIDCADRKSAIYSFGYVLTNERFNIIESKNILINPNAEWDPFVEENLLKHKIISFTGAPLFPKVYDKIKTLILDKDTVVIGFSVGNDFRFLREESKRYSLGKINCRSYDVQMLFNKVIDKEKSRLGLSKIAEQLSINTSKLQAHNSRDDAMITMLVFKEIVKKMKMSPKEALSWYSQNITTKSAKGKKAMAALKKQLSTETNNVVGKKEQTAVASNVNKQVKENTKTNTSSKKIDQYKLRQNIKKKKNKTSKQKQEDVKVVEPKQNQATRNYFNKKRLDNKKNSQRKENKNAVAANNNVEKEL